MQSVKRSYYDELQHALDQLEGACNELRADNLKLTNRIQELEAELKESRTGSGVSTDHLSEVDRIALRNQIGTYIKRIDNLLGTA